MNTKCIYCRRDAETKDHVPPKNLFPKPRPSNLVTVPSCEDCNGGASDDDEYFRNILIFREGVTDSPNAAKVWQTVRGALRRENARKFTESLARAMFDKPVETPAGILLGAAPAINVDQPRMDRVLRRTIRGLYFSEFGHPMPSDHYLAIYHEEVVDSWPTGVGEMLGEIVAAATAQPKKRIGDDVFEYCFARVDDHATASAWAFRFYSRAYFAAINVPGDYRERAQDLLAIEQGSGEQ